jgi:hypothetical protein
MDVLLVEDNVGDARLAQEAFRASEQPINLHVTCDGVEAMAFLRQEGAYVHAPSSKSHLAGFELAQNGWP